MPRKRKMETRSQSSRYGSEKEPTSPKKMCLPLGDFSALPIEIVDAIISPLPISSIISLASTSRQWLEFIQGWFASNRVSGVMIDEIRHVLLLPGHSLKSWKDNIPFTFGDSNCNEMISFCTNFGELVRVTTLLNKKGEATRLLWLRRFMTEAGLNWQSSDYVLRGFGGFLNSCFKSSDPKEFAKIVQVVAGKIRMKTYIHTLLKYEAGMRQRHEQRFRQITRIFFADYRFLVASLKFFAENGKGGRRKRRMTPSEIARLIFVLHGPPRKSSEQIGWHYVSNPYVSASSMASLAHFLNMPFWREEPFSIEAILETMLGDKIKVSRWISNAKVVTWCSNAIGALFVNLNIELSLGYLSKQTLSSCADIVLAVGMHSRERMKEFLDRLKSIMSLVDFQKVCTNMQTAISKEIKDQRKRCLETCGDCTICPVCPMGSLKEIWNTSKSFYELVRSVPVRRSLRLQGQLKLCSSV